MTPANKREKTHTDRGVSRLANIPPSSRDTLPRTRGASDPRDTSPSRTGATERPLIRAKAPLRLSFAGGGTDVPPFPEREGGVVLSATIDRVAYATLAPRDDGTIRIEPVDFGATIEQDSRDKLLYDAKLDLIKGAIGRFDSPRSSGFDLYLHTDTPPGSGLGASSAMVVAVIGVLKEFENLVMTDYEVADLAYRIERVDLGIAGGYQDQYAATFGGFNFIEFYGDHTIVNPLRITQEVINELEHNLVLAYTGSSRLSGGIIDDQVQRYTRGEEETLRALQEVKALAVEMKNLLLRRRLEKFAELLGAEWAAKRRMSPKISTPAIDQMYEEALREGAIGGKVTGAGGGGYMILYCRYNRKHRVLQRLVQMGCTPAQFSFTSTGLQTWRVTQE